MDRKPNQPDEHRSQTGVNEAQHEEGTTSSNIEYLNDFVSDETEPRSAKILAIFLLKSTKPLQT
jgi:hypothetical protein